MIKEDGLPLGLGFGLAMNEKAMLHFATLEETEKEQVIEAARNVLSKKEMQSLINSLAELSGK